MHKRKNLIKYAGIQLISMDHMIIIHQLSVSLIRRFIEAVDEKKIQLTYGVMVMQREILYIDDLISAIDILILNRFEGLLLQQVNKQLLKI